MTSPPEVAVVPTGTANLTSVLSCLARCGARATLAEGPEAVREAPFVVLPGVGSFGVAALALAESGLAEPLRERIAADRPLLAICLGLQLLAESSEESPGVAGLALFPARVERFRTTVRVPHMGWNRVEPVGACRLRFLSKGEAYFAHSYRLAEAPSGWEIAMADHGGPFVAALARESLLACQFHPELSGAWGQALIRRWLEGGC